MVGGAGVTRLAPHAPQQSRLFAFDRLHRGVEAFMGRPVWTHEFRRSGTAEARGRNGETVADPLQMLVDMAGRDRVIALLLD